MQARNNRSNGRNIRIYEHSVFVNDFIALKEEHRYDLIPLIINQILNEND